MSGAFVDTSFLLALLLRRDVYHERALAWPQIVTRFRTERKKW